MAEHKSTVATLATIGGLFTLIGGVWAGTEMLDNRHVTRIEYVAMSDAYDELAYTLMKREIRELRAAIREADPEYREDLRADLEDAIDRLCLRYPSDRECRSR